MIAVTQTLLSSFGSRVVSPSTGLLLNNGVMWFDPEPGKANSLGPGKRCLMNVCPFIGEIAKDDGGVLRSEEHTSELQSLMRISYAVFCLKKKTHNEH